MNKTETPVQWCERMQAQAPNGDAAYDYYRLTETWKKRECES